MKFQLNIFFFAFLISVGAFAEVDLGTAAGFATSVAAHASGNDETKEAETELQKTIAAKLPRGKGDGDGGSGGGSGQGQDQKQQQLGKGGGQQGGAQASKSPNREKAEEGRKMGEKYSAEIAKSGEKVSEAIDKSTQALNSMLSSLKQNDNDAESVKNIQNQVAEFGKNSSQPFVNKDSLKTIDETLNQTAKLYEKAAQEKAMLSQVIFRPKEVSTEESVGDKIKKYFSYGRAPGSSNGLQNATQLTEPQTQIPQGQVHSGH